MTLVVDASVALKWFVAEPDMDPALNVLAAREDLIAPELIVAELCNAAWRLRRRNEMTREQVSIIASRAPHMFVERFPSDGLAPRGSIIAMQLDHPVYDCFYLALAERADAPKMTGTPWKSHALHLEIYA